LQSIGLPGSFEVTLGSTRASWWGDQWSPNQSKQCTGREQLDRHPLLRWMCKYSAVTCIRRPIRAATAICHVSFCPQNGQLLAGCAARLNSGALCGAHMHWVARLGLPAPAWQWTSHWWRGARECEGTIVAGEAESRCCYYPATWRVCAITLCSEVMCAHSCAVLGAHCADWCCTTPID
jgi:hypothetical protein